MSRKIFHDLLEKYNKGLCTDAEKQIVEQWYELLDTPNHVLEPEELSLIEQKLWSKISMQISVEESIDLTEKANVQWSLKKIIGIAAILCLVISLIVLIRQPAPDQNAIFLADNAHALKTIYNVSATSKIIKLEDGSVVTLEPKANLTFPMHFKDSVREVSLVGNGFFLISKNPKRPFLVYNKHIITRVLGTSFSIRLNPNTNEVEVTVKTGKVMVTPNHATAASKVPVLFTKPRGVTLVPNEKTIYNDAEGGFNTTLADNPVPVVKVHARAESLLFRFNDVPVKDVIAQLIEVYGIQIILKTDDLNEVTFTGDLSSLNLYKKLDFLCQSINANYHVDGTRILIAKND